MKREGIDVARCTVARLMRQIGLKGVIRGKPVNTTISDKATPCPLDRVNRQFKAPAVLRPKQAIQSVRKRRLGSSLSHQSSGDGRRMCNC